MILFPAIDLKDGKCVRLTQGDFNRTQIYNPSPINQAKLFEDLGVQWLHCVDLDGALEGVSRNTKSIEEICTKTNLKIQCGGGIRTKEQVNNFLSIGISNIILGTAAFEDKEFFNDIVNQFPNSISLALDIKNNQIATKGWVDVRKIDLDSFLHSIDEMQINSIICTDVMRDGMKKGINHQMLEDVMSKTKIPCVASGGVSSIEDIKLLKSKNYPSMKGIIVGKAIYDQELNIKIALETLE
jgi:phosphoribosylformimino-5-aminoimidazole carboxamide ribotide isomerase